MRIFFKWGRVSYPIKKDNFDVIDFLENKIKNNEKIQSDELKEFVEDKYLDEIILEINEFYILDTKYCVKTCLRSPYDDHERLFSLYILPEKYMEDYNKVWQLLCYISEEDS